MVNVVVVDVVVMVAVDVMVVVVDVMVVVDVVVMVVDVGHLGLIVNVWGICTAAILNLKISYKLSYFAHE